MKVEFSKVAIMELTSSCCKPFNFDHPFWQSWQLCVKPVATSLIVNEIKHDFVNIFKNIKLKNHSLIISWFYVDDFVKLSIFLQRAPINKKE